MTANNLTDKLFDDADTSPIDPFSLFEDWFAEAQLKEPNDPHAMALATVDADGLPDVRMVLLNARDHRGFCFFTNFESEKGKQLLAHPKAAFVMHWKSLRRQIRVRGPVEVVSDSEADAYFVDARPGQPDRRACQQAVAAAGQSLRAAGARRDAEDQPWRRWRGDAAGALVGLPRGPADHRVLEGWRQSPA